MTTINEERQGIDFILGKDGRKLKARSSPGFQKNKEEDEVDKKPLKFKIKHNSVYDLNCSRKKRKVRIRKSLLYIFLQGVLLATMIGLTASYAGGDKLCRFKSETDQPFPISNWLIG